MRSAVKRGEQNKCPHDLFPVKSVYLQSLLKNKHVMFIGDSSEMSSFFKLPSLFLADFRGLYKDFICLLQEDRILEQGELKGKVLARNNCGVLHLYFVLTVRRVLSQRSPSLSHPKVQLTRFCRVEAVCDTL